jgi:probable rRNA maturation factor
MKIFIENRQGQLKINQKNIGYDSRKILGMLGIENAELSILIVNDKKMRELNRRYRGVDRTTDVLSFPQYSSEARKSRSAEVKTSELPCFRTSALVLGDVVINTQAAMRQLSEHGLTFKEEIRWLLIHGILHLVGYDHERSRYAERKMRAKERELLDCLGGQKV